MDASVVVAVADGDFLASTYADTQLAPTSDSRFKDRLVLWRPGKATDYTEVDVSNSVTSPPEILALSADGRYAYVVERLGQRQAEDRQIADLGPGGRISLVELDTGAAPRVISSVNVGPHPESIDLRPDGRMLAVVSNAAGRNLLHLVKVNPGELGAVRTFDLAESDFAVTNPETTPAMVSGVYWHPNENLLAVTMHSRDRVLFLRVDGSDTSPRLVPWGAPVSTGTDPFVGRFTPDGRHFLSLDWGRNLAAKSLEERLPSTPSRISIIRLADPNAANPEHRRIGEVDTDLSSEGIAISPGGDLVAVVSMRGTPLPAASRRHTSRGSVILFSFDPRNGELTRLDRQEFEGVLPEGASFDRSGQNLLVTVFEQTGCSGGALLAFRVRGEGKHRHLERGGKLPTPHGLHHVVVR